MQRIGAGAAIVQAIAALATLGVAVGWIGVSALADGQRIVEIAVRDPAPLIVQDALKLVAVVVGSVLLASARADDVGAS